MSIDNNNIDQMFSDAAHSQKAPQYDPAYWAEMNAMLNAKDAKKRGFILWAFGGSALFAALFLSLFILNMDFNKPQERYAQTALSSDIQTDQAETTVEQIAQNDKLNQEENTFTSETENKQLGAKKQAVNTVVHAAEGQNKIGIAENNARTSDVKAAAPGTTKTSERMNNANVKSFEKANNTASSEQNAERVNKKQTITSDAVLYNTAENNELNDERWNSDLIESLPYNPQNSIDQDDAGDLFKSTLKYKPRPTLAIYAKVSGGLMENYKTSRPYESGLVDLSLNLEMNFSGVVLRSGIGAQHTGHADLIVSQRAKVYGFGVTRHQNDLSYQSLFDLYIPLELGYRINGTSFGIGVQANYLMTTAMDLNLYEDKNLVGTEKYYGSTNGLNKFSTQGYVWMEHQLTSRFSLGAKVGTNISGRIKDDSYFNQSSTTNPIYGQFTLRFNIIQ